MKKNIIIIVYSVLLSLNIYGQTSLPLKSYKVDKSHTNIGFTISHFVISDVLGSFKDLRVLLFIQRMIFLMRKLN